MLATWLGDFPFRLLVPRHAVAQNLPPRPCHRALVSVHFEFQFLFQKLPDRRHHPFARRSTAYVDIASSRPGESHPQALTDPDMNVSAHPALIVQSAQDVTTANEQTAVGLSRQSCVPIALPFADVVSSVCISP